MRVDVGTVDPSYPAVAQIELFDSIIGGSLGPVGAYADYLSPVPDHADYAGHVIPGAFQTEPYVREVLDLYAGISGPYPDGYREYTTQARANRLAVVLRGLTEGATATYFVPEAAAMPQEGISPEVQAEAVRSMCDQVAGNEPVRLRLVNPAMVAAINNEHVSDYITTVELSGSPVGVAWSRDIALLHGPGSPEMTAAFRLIRQLGGVAMPPDESLARFRELAYELDPGRA